MPWDEDKIEASLVSTKVLHPREHKQEPQEQRQQPHKQEF